MKTTLNCTRTYYRGLKLTWFVTEIIDLNDKMLRH